MKIVELDNMENEEIGLGAALKGFLKSELDNWELARKNYEALSRVVVRKLEDSSDALTLQHNPARIVSTNAAIDKKSLAQRPCFLCAGNRPAEQGSIKVLDKYQLLVNPFPILPEHFTIPLCQHEPQSIRSHYRDMMELTRQTDGWFVFYNGPQCGASAPDHMHFQAGIRGVVPLERDWHTHYNNYREQIVSITDEEGIFVMRNYVCPVFLIVTRSVDANDTLFQTLYDRLPKPVQSPEPMMNILAWTFAGVDGQRWINSVVIPRGKHRPDCYFAEGDDQILVSPGAIDMGGLLIMPREKDYQNLSSRKAESIIREVGLSDMEFNQVLESLKDTSKDNKINQA